jgi:hypothetical protein
MSPVMFLSKSRGTGNLIARIRAVLSRFGISPERFVRLLDRYSTVTRTLNCTPTFPIPAQILKRHPGLIRALCRRGVEMAVHGYIHTDYGVLPLEEQDKHFKKAVAIFNECRVSFTGFRAPFLRINDRTPRALSTNGFTYDSSYAINWDVLEKVEYPESCWEDYTRLIDFYQSKKAQDYLALPRPVDGYIEIPVSIPDDEAIVDRLNIIDGKEISRIWQGILAQSYARGELFNIQLHPERISFCESALVDVIQKAKELVPPVWIATLKEIAAWWREKDGFSFEISPSGGNRYRIKANCTGRATILIKKCRVDREAAEWADGYQSVGAGDFVLESPVRPVIGVGRDTSPAALEFLKSEGYPVERGEKSGNFSIYLDGLSSFGRADERPLAARIEQSAAPLLRYWRWPDRSRSAVSVTGDIDSITLMDFVLRIYENWRQSRKLKVHS